MKWHYSLWQLSHTSNPLHEKLYLLIARESLPFPLTLKSRQWHGHLGRSYMGWKPVSQIVVTVRSVPGTSQKSEVRNQSLSSVVCPLTSVIVPHPLTIYTIISNYLKDVKQKTRQKWPNRSTDFQPVKTRPRWPCYLFTTSRRYGTTAGKSSCLVIWLFLTICLLFPAHGREKRLQGKGRNLEWAFFSDLLPHQLGVSLYVIDAGLIGRFGYLTKVTVTYRRNNFVCTVLHK